MTPAFGYRADSTPQCEDADADRKKRRGGSCGESRDNLDKTSESALERVPLFSPPQGPPRLSSAFQRVQDERRR